MAFLLVVSLACAIWAVYRLQTLRAQLAAERDRNLALVVSGSDAAAAARASEARLETILQQLPIGIVRTDHDGRIKMANEQAARMFGRPLGQLPGKTIAEMAHIADRADLMMFFEGMSEGGRAPDIKLRSTVAGRPALRVRGGLASNHGPDSLLLAIECMA
ncbi:MAG: hypothetical protein DCF31_03345 [Alphaproteobacteria bacterium]|nr:MAG: hypothetical protein DCF31_03345 [Alphaproteobacteria bacterium]